jgi:spermidine/putrescine transport system substrate-binding protein
VFIWTDYIAPELKKAFEREHGVRVRIDTYNSNETMHAKLLISKSAFDIIVPSGDYISILINDDLLDQIDKTRLPNYKNIDAMIMKKVHDYEFPSGFAVPYFWGTSGLIYNRNYISDEEMSDVSWDILGEERFNDKKVITMLDDMREVIGAALIFNGFDANDTSDTALSAARETLLRWNKNIVQYDSDSFKNEIQDGTIWIGHAYNGDALQVMEDNPDVGFALPIEGSTLWVDFLAIPKNSENKDLAHKFINFLLDAEVAYINAEYVMYATPNELAFKQLDLAIQQNENIYPHQDYINKSFLLKNIKEEAMKMNQIWQEIRGK